MDQRESWRRKKATYRAKHAHRCSRCCGLRDLPGRKCSWCLAQLLEDRFPDTTHDTAAHAALLMAASDPGTACAASRLPLLELSRFGFHLEVDRIDAGLGYVAGNMQLLASRLNRVKWRGKSVPRWAVDELVQIVRGPRNPEAEAWRKAFGGH